MFSNCYSRHLTYLIFLKKLYPLLNIQGTHMAFRSWSSIHFLIFTIPIANRILWSVHNSNYRKHAFKNVNSQFHIIFLFDRKKLWVGKLYYLLNRPGH